MRTLNRVRIHRVHGLPIDVDRWDEPVTPTQADVYVNADHFTAEEARELERYLNTPH